MEKSSLGHDPKYRCLETHGLLMTNTIDRCTYLTRSLALSPCQQFALADVGIGVALIPGSAYGTKAG